MIGIGIRKATASDREACADILAEAFDRDPAINWLVRQDQKRAEAIHLLFQVAFDKLTFPYGDVYITENSDGAALWTPPGSWQLGFPAQLMLLPNYLRACKFSRMHVVIPRIQAIQRLHPSFPHYYLFALGVKPPLQGRGIGSDLLRHVLAKCDEMHLPAYLEASAEQNRDLYMRHGFMVVREFLMGDNGPMLWFMLRDPGFIDSV